MLVWLFIGNIRVALLFYTLYFSMYVCIRRLSLCEFFTKFSNVVCAFGMKFDSQITIYGIEVFLNIES